MRDLGKSNLGKFLLCFVILDQVALCSRSSESTETWPETKLSPTVFPSTSLLLNLNVEPVF